MNDDCKHEEFIIIDAKPSTPLTMSVLGECKVCGYRKVFSVNMDKMNELFKQEKENKDD